VKASFERGQDHEHVNEARSGQLKAVTIARDRGAPISRMTVPRVALSQPGAGHAKERENPLERVK
jgi:hypothetical protein